MTEKQQASAHIPVSQDGTHKAMLKKLRMRFVTLIMIVLALVLTVTFAVLVVMDWQRGLRELESGLHLAIEWAQQEEHEALTNGDSKFIGGPRVEDRGDQPSFGKAVYKITSSEDGDAWTTELVSLASSAELDSELLQTAIDELDARESLCLSDDELSQTMSLGQGGSQDNLGQDGYKSSLVFLKDLGLVYIVQPTPDGAYVAFADASVANGWTSLAVTLAIAEIVLLLLFLLVSVFFSRWALRPVENAWRRQQEFIADASHELKTPLTIILANMSLALKNPQESIASQQRWLESTQREAQDMQGLVTDMLELAGLDEGISSQGFEKIDFSELVEGDLLQFESLLFERGVVLEDSLDPDIFIFGEKARVQRLVGTLLDNASKYAGSKVSVSLRKVGQQAHLLVSNDGALIPEDELPLVFDRFYRADKARTRTGGSGLGLAIAHEIVQAHGGTISVSSDPLDDGQACTTFTVKLPIAKA